MNSNKNVKARAANTRSAKATKAVYTPPSQLTLPESLRKKFLNEGCVLRWINVMLRSGQPNLSNISNRMSEGYEFVTRNEIPADLQHMFESRKVSNANDTVCVKDLALAKLPVDIADARDAYYQQMAINQQEGVERDLLDDDRARRYTPGFNDSKVKVIHGTRNTDFGETSDE